ncbi:AraC family transcriptional regulator [Vibrio sp.]|uniref:AraC family transcriptional regulator n=1 Tax=Vibrio sp. TaxID=678 RepID=UPI003D09A93B
MSSSPDQRIKRVCDYIDRHLDQRLSLDVLSQVACCSKYHFHRVFKASVGVSAVQYVQLARLRRASFRLAFETQFSVLDIALEAKFDSHEAFSRAFNRQFAVTPSQFRRSPDWLSWHSVFTFQLPNAGEHHMDVSLVDMPPQQLAVIEHYGDPKRVLETAAKFIEWRKSTGLSPLDNSKTFGIPYSDPAETPEEEFRFDICGTIDGDVPDNAFGVKSGWLPGGRFAVARHFGSHDNIGDTVYALYRQWLPESGEQLRDFPCFFHYHNFVHQVNECDLITDVYLPLQ